MSEYHRIRVIQGKAYIVDDEGNKIPPDDARGIMDTLTNTVDEPKYVYLGWSEEKQLHKIGISNDPDRRSKEVGMEVLATMECEAWGENSALEYEKVFHERFKLLGYHVDLEWFRLSDTFAQLLVWEMNNIDVEFHSINESIKLWQDDVATITSLMIIMRNLTVEDEETPQNLLYAYYSAQSYLMKNTSILPVKESERLAQYFESVADEILQRPTQRKK